MKSKDFLINQINSLVLTFPYLQARYEFDSFSKSHFIEILPLTSYKTDKLYIVEEQRIVFKFIKEFPFETITFLSEGDLYSIENPTYIKKGWEFELKQVSF